MEKKLTVKTVTLKHLLYKVETKEWQFYENNRGKGQFNDKVVLAIKKEGLDFSKIQPELVKFSNNRYVFADNNSRVKGAVERHYLNKFTRRELNKEISLLVHEGSHPHKLLLDVYRRNNEGRKHTATNKIVNPDLFFGPLIKQLGDMVNRPIPNRLIPFMARVLYVIEREGIYELSFAKVFGKRCEVGELMNCLANDKSIVISDSTLNRVKKGLLRLFELQDKFLNTQTGNNRGKTVYPETVKRVMHSGGLWGFLLTDILKKKSEIVGVVKEDTLCSWLSGRSDSNRLNLPAY